MKVDQERVKCVSNNKIIVTSSLMFLKSDFNAIFLSNQGHEYKLNLMSPLIFFHLLRKILCNSHLKCWWVFFYEIFQVIKAITSSKMKRWKCCKDMRFIIVISKHKHTKI